MKAFHYKVNGEWKAYTFTDFFEECKKFGKTLIHLQLQRFDAVSIIGFNSSEWVIADLGTIFAGCVAAGIYTTNSPSACEYIIGHSNSKVVVCDGEKQLEKFISIQKNLTNLKAIVVYNVASVPERIKLDIPVYTFQDFLKLGENIDDVQIEERMSVQKPGNCCTLIYTSGTTGAPKAVMLSHDNIVFTISSVLYIIKKRMNYKLDNKDRLVSYLPMSHVAAQLLDILLPIVTGLQVFFAQFAQPDALKGTLAVTLKEVRPTLFFGVPRVWEKIAEKMWAISNETTGLKKRIAEWAKSRGSIKSELAQYGNSGGAPCGYGVAHALVLSRIHEALGFDQCRACLSGAAPISKVVLDYFASLDIPIYELFGQSESCGPQTFSLPNIWKIGSCGLTIEGSSSRVVEETGELIFKGRNIMMGYLNAEEQTKDTIDDDGWLHSGDSGKIDEDGFLSITGRIKELIITAGGENIPPVLLEDTLKEEMPLLSNAMVIGDQRKFLSVLLTFRVTVDGEGYPTQTLDAKALDICQQIGSAAKSVDEAQKCPKIKEYLDQGLKRANDRAVSRAQNIAKYEIISTDFSAPGGELTPTLKVRRKVILEKYSELVEQIYA